MVMPYGWMKTTCEDCGWTCVTNQPSDVLMLPRRCGKCGGSRLLNEKATMGDVVNLAKVGRGIFAQFKSFQS